MKAEEKRALRIFLQFSFLIALMGAVNLYLYYQEGRLVSLIVAILSGVAFIGWVVYYRRYIRARE
ncbi:MAG TPA: hypothetical protein VNO14_02555 [Blastocatellia bacterium]|nr:hypothetical protein [Blastocatellia bacterium]